jgi:toxin ParE1/3/4
MSAHNYRLKFTPKAEDDLDQIYGHIFGTLSAATAADRLVNQADEQVVIMCILYGASNYQDIL